MVVNATAQLWGSVQGRTVGLPTDFARSYPVNLRATKGVVPTPKVFLMSHFLLLE